MKKLMIIAVACIAFASCGTQSAEAEKACCQDSTAVCAADSAKSAVSTVTAVADSTVADTTKK